MDRNWNKREGVSAMQRIAATLDVLAGLAGRLGAVPLPLRLLVLWAFRHGEAAVRAFVIDMALASGQPFALPAPAAAGIPDSIAEAARLDAAFRALARALCAIAAAESRAAATVGNGGHGGNPAAICLRRLRLSCALLRALRGPVRAAGFATPTAAPDTS